MAIFGKNANETAYTGGKKHWMDVIKNSGPGDLLIWRQPEEDFNTNSTLIVMPGEEAIFINGGLIESVRENGTYRLDTDNLPVIGRIRNWFTGGVSAFNCVVYFVRTAHSMEILWGTSSPIQVRDKLLGIATKLGARGSYKIQISDGAKFLTKMIGNNISFETQQNIELYFANEFQEKIKSTLTQAMNETGNELLGIEARLEEFSNIIEPRLAMVFDDYGIKLVKFSISAISILDDELRRRYDEIGMDAIGKLRNAQADRAVMDTLGDDWGRQQATEILHDVANNPGAGGVAAMGAGLGMGMAAGNTFGGLAQQMFAPMAPPQQPTPPQQPSSRFTQAGADAAPGEAAPVAGAGMADEIMKLKGLLDAGVITQEDFDAAKKKLLGL